jgi:thiamine-phosphate pyrophosphorylase
MLPRAIPRRRAPSMPAARIDEASARRRGRAQRVAGLYAVTPDLADTDALATRVASALAGGAAAIQYRNKSADAALQRAQAMALARVHAIRGGLFIVNDDAELAVEAGADGVHVGEDDAAIAAARAIVGPDRIVGASCYNDLARARDAVAAGADYVAFGSFFPSPVKPGARRADVGLLGPARAFGVPVVAIGGITADNARVLVRAGASAVAVITAVFDAPDVEAAARAIAGAFPPMAFAFNPVPAP